MSNIEIHCVRMGYSNSVILKNGNFIVIVDTGVSGYIHKFGQMFKTLNILPTQTGIIVLTHTHYDHTGNLPGLTELTGAKVLVHRFENENLKTGFIPIPRGNGPYSTLISRLGRTIVPKFASPKPFKAHLINENEFDLSPFGIDGKVISTPGHTVGSQSVILGKKLISGDTFINLKNGIMFPHFADDPVTLLKTWENLFSLGIEKVYPGHGVPFAIEKVYPEYKKALKKFVK